MKHENISTPVFPTFIHVGDGVSSREIDRERVGDGRGEREREIRGWERRESERVGDGRGKRVGRERVGYGGWWDRERLFFT